MNKKQQQGYIDGSTAPLAVGAAALAGMAVGLVIIAGTLSQKATQNHDNMAATRDMLDASASHVFNSVADCAQNYGYSAAECTASQKEALRVAGNDGTTLSYDSAEICADKHTSCDKYEDWRDSFTNISYYKYKPEIVGWQAKEDDLQTALPLYKSTQGETAIRYDGKTFPLGNPAP